MGIKKYTTEEQRIAAKKEKKAELNKQYYEANKDAILERNKRRYEDNKDAIAERMRRYNKANREKIADYNKRRYEANKAAILEQQQQYRKTPFGRANNLIYSYRQQDKKYNRGECTLTAQWIVDNIFTSKCRYCGKDDWHKLGCDRINNDLPHTPDNVVCCCEDCNTKRGRKTFEEFIKMR